MPSISMTLSLSKMNLRTSSRGINWFDRAVWVVINVFFGGFAGFIMILWVSCDMKMPIFFLPVLPFSFLQRIFDVPWVVMNLSLPSKIFVNAFLFALFGFVHTFFAQDYVQQYVITKLSLPNYTLRTFYLVLTTLAAWLLMSAWQHTSIQLWDILRYFSIDSEPNRHRILFSVFTLVNIPNIYATIQFDLSEFFGLKQIFQLVQCPVLSRTTGTTKLVTDGAFRYCRHPMYLTLLLGFILSPCVSLDRCLFTIYATTYLYIAIPIEEKKLEKIFGPAYIEYKNTVPAVVPTFFAKKKNYKL